MTKTEVVYEGWNPNGKSVTHVAIKEGNHAPYVFRVYFDGEPKIPTSLQPDIPVFQIEEARQKFKFRKGCIADLTRY